jgi:outer membrane receptor for ferric coprogen and ferric-rhodotorulic acid
VPWNDPDSVAAMVHDFTVPEAAKTPYTHDRTTTNGLYTQARFSVLDPLKAWLGIRVSNYHSTSVNYSWEETSIQRETGESTPYAGIIWDATKHLSLYVSYADIFRSQIGRKFSGDEDSPDAGLVDPSVGWQTEFGVKGEFFDKRLNVTAAIFRLEDTGRSYYADTYDDIDYYYNAGKVRNDGVEFEVSGMPWPGYELTGGYTYLNSEVRTGSASMQGKPLNDLNPKHQFKLWGVRRFPFGLSVGGGFTWISARAWNRATSPALSQGSYSLAHAYVNYSVTQNLTVSLNVNNIYDTTYYTRFGGMGTIVGEPRNVTLGFRYDF